ncbi:MAG: FAD-dependent oxidoreductase [Pseudomonadota bacterium]
MGKHLVFVGGGHAHLTALLHLDRYVQQGHQVTLISSSAYHYYSGMGPGMLSGIYRPQEVRFHVKKLTQDRGGRFVEERVVKIDPLNHSLVLSNGEQVRYDVVSFNTGSEIPSALLISGPLENVFPVKPVVNLLQARHSILKALPQKKLKFAVVGGGPAGVEIASNLWRLIAKNNEKAQITLIGGKRLMGDFPEKVRSLVLKSFTKRGIEVIEGDYVKKIQKGTVFLSDANTLAFDFAFIALGIKPLPLFLDSGLPTGEDGGLLVNAYLQSVAHPGMFGGGDCISLSGRPLAKVGVYAVRQNPILFHNLLAALEGGGMQLFQPQKDYMLIFNMGDGRGILRRKKWIWDGRLAFVLKDYIDRKFMKQFQVSGELKEQDEGIE